MESRRAPALALLGALTVSIACAGIVRSVQAANIPSFAGPFHVYGKRFWRCGEHCEHAIDWKVRVTHFNPHKPNELQRVTGFFHVRKDTGGVTDALWVKSFLDKRSNNEWKENSFIWSFPAACSNFRKHMPDWFRTIFGGTGFTGKCYVPPGNYTFEDKPIRWEYPYFPVMPYGEYRFRMTMGNMSSSPLHCLCCDAIIIPKVQGGRG